MNSHADVGSAQKGGSLVPLGSTGIHDPPTLKSGRWPRAKSLYSIVSEDKMS